MSNKMKVPSYERQNQWISDYIEPIMIDLDVGRVIQNYKRNKRLVLRSDMRNAGVFGSLERLENKENSWDKIMSKMKEGIGNAKRAKMYNQIYFMGFKDLFPKGKDFIMNIGYMKPLGREGRLSI